MISIHPHLIMRNLRGRETHYFVASELYRRTGEHKVARRLACLTVVLGGVRPGLFSPGQMFIDRHELYMDVFSWRIPTEETACIVSSVVVCVRLLLLAVYVCVCPQN